MKILSEKCQIFTPEKYVFEMLDLVGYSKNLFGKKVLENSCGDGNILREIVRRYINDALELGVNLNDICSGLESDIFGYEIDEKHFENCKVNLDRIATEYGIKNVEWKIFRRNSLEEKYEVDFDFVIGNPPYISYRDLDVETRESVKEHYESCKVGKFDYCYPFIESSINNLRANGKLIYLIPNSIFKNVFGKKLREIILPHTIKIIDFSGIRVFNDAQTSSAILVCEKDSNADYIEYKNIFEDTNKTVLKANLGLKWIFSDSIESKEASKRFGDYFKASISIATLYNKAFVLREFEEEDDFFRVGEYLIEKEVTRMCASPKALKNNLAERIIFPYSYNENSLIRFEKEVFEREFANTAEYLESFSAELAKRNSDSSTKWFEYGRSQALAHLNQPKLLVSTLITNEVRVYNLAKECIPYSGIYIVSDGRLPLSKAKEILETRKFFDYAMNLGIGASGISKRITPSDINDFMF